MGPWDTSYESLSLHRSPKPAMNTCCPCMGLEGPFNGIFLGSWGVAGACRGEGLQPGGQKCCIFVAECNQKKSRVKTQRFRGFLKWFWTTFVIFSYAPFQMAKSPAGPATEKTTMIGPYLGQGEELWKNFGGQKHSFSHKESFCSYIYLIIPHPVQDMGRSIFFFQWLGLQGT